LPDAVVTFTFISDGTGYSTFGTGTENVPAGPYTGGSTTETMGFTKVCCDAPNENNYYTISWVNSLGISRGPVNIPSTDYCDWAAGLDVVGGYATYTLTLS
jgi:hypothetical protein